MLFMFPMMLTAGLLWTGGLDKEAIGKIFDMGFTSISFNGNKIIIGSPCNLSSCNHARIKSALQTLNLVVKGKDFSRGAGSRVEGNSQGTRHGYRYFTPFPKSSPRFWPESYISILLPHGITLFLPKLFWSRPRQSWVNLLLLAVHLMVRGELWPSIQCGRLQLKRLCGLIVYCPHSSIG